jgi:pimeloyl-ACP methyl ester carboxylesterase
MNHYPLIVLLADGPTNTGPDVGKASPVALLIVVLTVINIVGIDAGKRTQNFLTVIEVSGLVAIIIAGFFFASPEVVPAVTSAVPAAADAAKSSTPDLGMIGLAMVFVLLTYGGYLATTLLGREHPFKALIAHAAVYNEYTQIGSDFGAEKARFYQYWEKPAEFQANSPHMAAANFKTPTLVIHGQLDQRVPVNHGMELFNTLQNKGIPSKFVYFPDENHWVLKPQNSLFWYEQVKDWVTHYAAPGPQ